MNRPLRRALTRIAHEIIEKNKGIDDLLMSVFGQEESILQTDLPKELSKLKEKSVPVGELDITLYRDDLTY